MTMRTSIFALSVAAAVMGISAGPVSRSSDAANFTMPFSTPGIRNVKVQPSLGGKSVCVTGLVSVAAKTSANLALNFTPPSTQLAVNQFTLDFDSPSSTLFQSVNGGPTSVSGTYDMFVQLCLPPGGALPKAVQLLTHGGGFDHTYWDFQPGYSYVDVATAAGYATLNYDRLGVGQSAKPDPIQDTQLPLQVEIAEALAQLLLKPGALVAASHQFTRVLGVGHSIGSVITQAVTRLYPATLAATALTGASGSSSGLPTFFAAQHLALANQVDPARFGHLSNGYVIADSASSVQLFFFGYPYFSPAVLSRAAATGATTTFGEVFTLQAVTAPATGYTAPVVVVNGARDGPNCFLNCSYPTDLLAEVRTSLYPNVAEDDFATHTLEGAGHGLNLHYGADGAFGFIQNFFKAHGV